MRSLLSRSLLALSLVYAAVGCRQLAGYEVAREDRDASSPADALSQRDTRGDFAAPVDAWGCPAAPLLAPPLLHLDFDGASAGAVPNLGSLGGQGTLHAPATLEPTGGICGGALRNVDDGSAAAGYLEFPDLAGLRLREGLIELWVRFDREAAELVETEGIFSRDAVDQARGGHLSLMRMAGGHLLARQQLAWVGGGFACVGASELQAGVWHHVLVAFGGAGKLELYVGGRRGELATSDPAWPCGNTVLTRGLGIEGNRNPWVIGASGINTVEDKAGPVRLPLVGAIDELRIYGQRLGY